MIRNKSFECISILMTHIKCWHSHTTDACGCVKMYSDDSIEQIVVATVGFLEAEP